MAYIVFVTLLCFSVIGFAQNGSTVPLEEIESLFQDEAEEEVRYQKKKTVRYKKTKKENQISEVDDLKSLETFSNIAVIQKRFLPKTERFEFYIAGATNLNDAFFVGNGLNARLGYNFNERWGVEGMYSYIQNDNRDITNGLLERGVTTNGSVTTDSYFGIDLKWTPVYGKYAYFNEKIIPFDLYFSLGFGQTDPRIAASSGGSTFSTVNSSYTVKLGTGQIFAITKWMAFRWDMSFHMIQADTETREVGTNNLVSQDSSLSNNLFLSVGLSFFFPEAKYR